MTPHQRNLLLLVILLAAGASAIWWLTRPRPVEVGVAEVQRGTVEQTVANTRAGTVKACRRAGLSPAMGGQIARLPVSEGQRVKAGTLLLELWNEDLKARLAVAGRQIEVNRAQADAACHKAEVAGREAERIRRLHQRKLASDEQLDKARSAAEASADECRAARARVRLAEAQQQAASAELERTRLVAPFDGVVAEINGELSEYVTPSPVGVQTLPVVDLIATGCYRVTVPIDEADIAGVESGLPARITLDAFGDTRFPGTVRRVADYVLDREKQARTVDVEIDFDRQEDLARMRAGFSADAEIILGKHEG
ncbi:MAG: efflux RND transporter periplasmic adaptor subunit, partial [Gammaproteobacteria bacterium]